MSNPKHAEEDSGFYDLFIPLTIKKAIHIIAIVGFVVFFNIFFNGFVWDDIQYILQNQSLHTFNVANLIGANIFNTAGQYRPIPALYFSFLYTLFQDNAFFYHFIQLIIHIMNASLLFLFLKKFISKEISLFMSLIFLVHPMQVESVSYIAATGNALFFSFGITALLLGSKAVVSPKRVVAIFLLLLLSMLTKETGVLFIICLLLQRLFFIKKQQVLFLVCSFATFLLYCLIRFTVGGVFLAKLPLIPIAQLSIQERILNMPMIVFYYLKTLVFPYTLAMEQRWIVKAIDFNNFYLPLFISTLFFVCLVILGKYLWNANRKNFYVYLFFVVWFLLWLVFHIQIMPLTATVADRWFYFALAGLVGILGIVIHQFDTHKRYTKILSAILIGIIIIFSVRTMVRNTDWVNAITLYTRDSQVYANYDIESYLGGEYAKLGQFDEAIKHYQKSVTLFPYEFNLYNIGYMYEAKSNLVKAEEYYYKALQSKSYFSKPQHAENTYGRLAYVLLQQKKYQEAKTVLDQGLGEYPESKSLWYFLAIDEHGLNHRNEALRAADRTKELWPGPETDQLYNQIKKGEKIQ